MRLLHPRHHEGLSRLPFHDVEDAVVIERDERHVLLGGHLRVPIHAHEPLPVGVPRAPAFGDRHVLVSARAEATNDAANELRIGRAPLDAVVAAARLRVHEPVEAAEVGLQQDLRRGGPPRYDRLAETLAELEGCVRAVSLEKRDGRSVRSEPRVRSRSKGLAIDLTLGGHDELARVVGRGRGCVSGDVGRGVRSLGVEPGGRGGRDDAGIMRGRAPLAACAHPEQKENGERAHGRSGSRGARESEARSFALRRDLAAARRLPPDKVAANAGARLVRRADELADGSVDAKRRAVTARHPHVRAVPVETHQLVGAFAKARVVIAADAHVRLEP